MENNIADPQVTLDDLMMEIKLNETEINFMENEIRKFKFRLKLIKFGSKKVSSKFGV
jgi:hypothetical protein